MATAHTKVFKSNQSQAVRLPKSVAFPEGIREVDVVAIGNTLVITRIDRLARSMKDLQDIVHLLKEKGAYLEATEQPIDTSSAAGKAFLDMLGVFAEFETAIRRERQMEGIAKAKAKGKYKGRKPTAKAKAAEALKLKAEGVAVTKICKELGISRSSFYRIEADAAAN